MVHALTQRQLRILRLFAAGLSTGEVAAKLEISAATVNNDVYYARAKLTGLARRPVRTRKEAVTVAREQGLIE